ncbi:hypothetical protein [Sphaerotilus sp.]|uniref:hypothetical protein n=1 Tax=Sphaerotilus sp. TaxID=2093942 RepID=UPI0034E1FB72
MSPPPQPTLGRSGPVAPAAIDIVLEDLQALAPSADMKAALAMAPRSSEQDGVHLRIDPQDHQRVRISGSMREVCAALDALIAVQ